MRRHMMAVTVAIGVLTGPSAHAVTTVGSQTQASTGVFAGDKGKDKGGGNFDLERGAGLLRAQSTHTEESSSTRRGHQGGESAAEGVNNALSDQQQALAQAQRIGACLGAAAGNPLSMPLVPVCAGVFPAAPGGGPAPTAAVVRQIALGKISMTAPKIGASPCSSAGACRGTVGVPVWLWVGDGDGHLPSDSASATAGPFSITATAKVSQVKWSLGDGQTTVCEGTGTPYDKRAHGWSTPDCGFAAGWKSAGTYTLTASYVWEISWSGDETGSATQTLSSTEQVTVGELQSVVTTG